MKRMVLWLTPADYALVARVLGVFEQRHPGDPERSNGEIVAAMCREWEKTPRRLPPQAGGLDDVSTTHKPPTKPPKAREGRQR